jgi:SSS family transporter
MHVGIGAIDRFTIAAYGVVLIAIAVYHSRKLKGQDDVFLAGRSMSRWPVAIAMYMALFSTNTFIGMTGWLNRPNGTLWIGLHVAGIVLAVPLVVWLYPALFFRLRITTAYEYLEKRFNYPVRAFAAVFFLASRIMWMSTMLYATGLVIAMMFGWTGGEGFDDGQVWAILVVGSLGMIYCFVGGMHAVIWNDVFQFFVLMGGVVVMAVLAVVYSGGIGEVAATAFDAGKLSPPPVFSLTDDASLFVVLLSGFISMLSSTGADQMLLQTYLTARSEREAKRSLWRNGLCLKPLSIMFPLLGLIMFVYYSKHPEAAAHMTRPDDALAVFVGHVLPVGIRGVVVAAILSAVLDSLASGMAATSASVQVDFIQRWRQHPLTGRQAVRLARILILVWGVTVTAAALWVRTLGTNNNILQILNIVMYPFAGVLLGVFLLGIVTLRANAEGTLIGAATGFLLTISLPLAPRIVAWLAARGALSAESWSWAEWLGQVSDFYYGGLATAATFTVGYLGSLLFAPPTRPQLEGLTKWTPALLDVPAKAAHSNT